MSECASGSSGSSTRVTMPLSVSVGDQVSADQSMSEGVSPPEPLCSLIRLVSTSSSSACHVGFYPVSQLGRRRRRRLLPVAPSVAQLERRYRGVGSPQAAQGHHLAPTACPVPVETAGDLPAATLQRHLPGSRVRVRLWALSLQPRGGGLLDVFPVGWRALAQQAESLIGRQAPVTNFSSQTQEDPGVPGEQCKKRAFGARTARFLECRAPSWAGGAR